MQIQIIYNFKIYIKNNKNNNTLKLNLNYYYYYYFIINTNDYLLISHFYLFISLYNKIQI